MKPVKKFFVYTLKLSLALLYLADMFINKLKTKFNSCLQNGFKYKENSQLLFKKFPTILIANQLPSRVSFVGKKTRRPFGHLRAKIVIVGSSKFVKNHHFCAQLSHSFSICLNNYSPQCRWLVVDIDIAASRHGNITASHLHFSE